MLGIPVQSAREGNARAFSKFDFRRAIFARVSFKPVMHPPVSDALVALLHCSNIMLQRTIAMTFDAAPPFSRGCSLSAPAPVRTIGEGRRDVEW